MAKQSIGHTTVGQAVMEILEDRNSDVIRHCQDVTTVDGKACEINIKIVVTPNKARNQFAYAVSGAAKLSGRYPGEATLFAAINDGEVEVQEFDPQQELNFNQ